MKTKQSNFIAILIIFFLLTISFLNHKSQYLTKFNFQKLEKLYNHSQFAPKPEERIFIIQDEDLYAYAGFQYLKTGKLDSINIEHPPLGKYFIGLSILVFNNQNVGQIIWGGLFLFLLYLFAKKVLKSKSLALLLVLFFSQELLFKDQLIYSLLDLPLGVFLLLFFLKSLEKKVSPKTIFIQGLSLGAIASIKYPTTALIAFVTLVVYYLLTKKEKIFNRLIIIGFIALGVFLISYLPFFIKNPSFISFYNLQFKALKIHLSHVPEYPKGQVFNVLLLNRWLSWWGDKNYIKTGFWNFIWPILTINFFITFLKFKKNLLINLWSFFYLSFISIRLFFPRYLFLLLPFFYIQLFFNIKVFVSKKVVV